MKTRRGFTLIELLAGVAVLSLLLLLIFNVIDRTGSLSSGSMSKMEAARIARECFDLIGRDLSGAQLPYNRSATNSLQFLVNPADLESSYANPHSFFWQAPLASSLENGNLAMAGYFVLREVASDPKQNRFQLRRLYVEQSDTNRFDRLSTNGGTAWYRSLAPEFAPATESPQNAQDYKGWVADGVLGLWVRCLDAKGSPIKLSAAGADLQSSFDSRKAFQSDRNRYPATDFSALPAFVEVGMVTCSPSDSRKITKFPSSVSSGNPDRFYQDLNAFSSALQADNPGAKSIMVSVRIIPILTADP